MKSRLVQLVAALWIAGAAFAADNPAAEWVTLGTAGGPIIHAEEAQISNALVVGDAVYLFDVGNGVLRQMAGAKLPVHGIRAVFISHHHPDHNSDMGAVLMAKWGRANQQQPLAVLGPPGTVNLINGLVSANQATADASYAVNGPANPPIASAVKATDLPAALDEPKVIYEDSNIRVSAIAVDHYRVPPSAPFGGRPLAVAFRIDSKSRSIVYTGDTGPTPNLAKLAKGADLLVSEVVDPSAIEETLRRTLRVTNPGFIEGVADRMRRSHLVPQEIGKVAAEAGVKEVVLTHFVPAMKDQPDPANFTKGIAPTFRGPVKLARDLARF